MAFVISKDARDAPDSPEALFRELRPRDPNVRDLLLRQGDVLREYEKLDPATRNVAIELPTGAGKTLAGLLIAEWRRQSREHRVAYLCPTVQLARQVATKAHGYGLDVVTLVRSHTTWDRADVHAFNRGKAVAIATYAAVFNSHPKIQEAQTLVLDDAHAGEDPVASPWSVRARRDKDPELYRELLGLVADGLLRPVLDRLLDDDVDPRQRWTVELVPPTTVAACGRELERAVHAHCPNGDHSNFFVMRSMEDRLGRCLMYVSWNEILLRPLIPPTATHRAFAEAEQRVYMSATLGASGELERAFGVPSMTRVQGRAGADEGGFGRRFFVLPNAVQPTPVADRIIRDAIKLAGRAVVLAPSSLELTRFEESCLPEDAVPVDADDVETDLAPFTSKAHGVLMLANRYDGIDLPDTACRLVVLTGLPANSHLQERFLLDTLGARRVLSERIRTRLIQGAGRATRGSRDYAAVLIRGTDLTDFCARDEELAAMPPQIQAELRFGLENSENPDVDPLELLAAFWKQDGDWRKADAQITADTSRAVREESDVARALGHAASAEVLCWQALWGGDLQLAYEHAIEVIDRLSGGPELRPYQALWSYLAAAWAFELDREAPDDAYRDSAQRLLREAAACARMLRWHPRLPELRTTAVEEEIDVLPARARAAASALRRIGVRGARFGSHVAELARLIGSDRSGEFEQGLCELGELLGFAAARPNGQADPDGVWNDDDEMWFLFEAKTEESADAPLSATTVRQAESHRRWVERQMDWPAPQRSLTVVVSPRATIDPAAATVAAGQALVAPQVLRDVAGRCIAAQRDVRTRARGLDDEELAAALWARFVSDGLDTPALFAELGGHRIADG